MKKESLFERIQKALEPIGSFLGTENHFASIQNVLMSIVGITLIGVIFQVIATPPVNQQLLDNRGFWLIFKGWFDFSQANSEQILLPYHMTMGLFSVAAVFSISYNLAKNENYPHL